MAESPVTPEECITAIQAAIGAEHVRAARPEEMMDGIVPRWVAEPGTPEEVAKTLSVANDAGLRVIPRGAGTKLDWGNPPRAADLVLSTMRLDRILEHAAGDMTATVQAGCGVAAFGTVLAQRGQRLALDPLCPDRATIGGILATNDSGALRATFGSLRDHLIGVTIALADGTLAKSGGKVVKNVAGYDLPKLIIGSFGTLAVITEATFRLYPLACEVRNLQFVAPTREVFIRALGVMAECAPLTTAVQLEMEVDQPSRILVRVEGLPGALEAKVRRVVPPTAGCGAVQSELESGVWSTREELFSSAESCICKFSILPSQWSEFMDAVRGITEKSQVRWKIVAQAFGLGLLCLHEAPSPVSVEVIRALRNLLDAQGGSLTVLHCPRKIKRQIDVWPDAGDALPLMRRVKEQFDPRGILSPGRFVGGI